MTNTRYKAWLDHGVIKYEKIYKGVEYKKGRKKNYKSNN